MAALLFKVEKLEAEIERDEALQNTSSKIRQRLARGLSKMPDLKAKLAAARKKMKELEEAAAAKKKEAELKAARKQGAQGGGEQEALGRRRHRARPNPRMERSQQGAVCAPLAGQKRPRTNQ